MIRILLLMFLMFPSLQALEDQSLKILHLTFHLGCKKEFEGIAKTLGYQLDTWHIPELPPNFFDGTTSGNALYNIGHERAERIWNLHKDTFSQYDLILVSDTSPLSRIFLQNQSNIPLMIWMCNRFDYYDGAALDCNFPDEEYYKLFKDALSNPKVKIFAYNAFEHYYTGLKNIHTGDQIITPCAPIPPVSSHSIIPEQIDRANTFFLPPYHNERLYMNLQGFCDALGIPSYCGRYNGPYDLKDFKGIIHLPYAWSNLALFENIQQGIVYFIPSRAFFLELARKPNYFHPELSKLVDEQLFDYSEWYMPSNEKLFIYFESWEDLAKKIKETNFEERRLQVKTFAQEYKDHTLKLWETVIFSLTGP